jgi:hypothetical protein
VEEGQLVLVAVLVVVVLVAIKQVLFPFQEEGRLP